MASKSWKSKHKDKPEEIKDPSQDGDLANSSPLPFEPVQNRKKTRKGEVQTPKSGADTTPKSGSSAKVTQSERQSAKQHADSVSSRSAAIPEIVSKRMVRRIALFCGIPSGLGMLTFIVSYIVVSQHYFKLPSVVVFLVSLGFFGLGVLGLSYGALSASWDEDRLGSWLGWSEFRTNFGRTTASWREARQKES